VRGIIAPYRERGEGGVEGGLMNNFPADVMGSLARGPVMGGDVAAGTPFVAGASELEEKSVLWLLRNRRDVVPSILRVLVRSATTNSNAQTALSRSRVDLLIQPRLEGIDMLSFDAFDTAVEFGYRAAMEAIEGLEKPLYDCSR